MSLAKKCDCCGAFYDFYIKQGSKDHALHGSANDGFNGLVPVAIEPDNKAYTVGDPIDLCPDCMGKVLEALTIPQTETGDGEAEETA